MLRSMLRDLVYQYQAEHPEQRMTFARMAELFGVPVWFLQALWHDKIQRLNLGYADKVCEALGVGLGDLYVREALPTVVEHAVEIAQDAVRRLERGNGD